MKRTLFRAGGTAVRAAAMLMTLLAATSTIAPITAAALDRDLARWVDPLIGTQPGDADMGTGGGAANTFPGADVPFGMVQWSPDTVTQQHGGYFYDDNRIQGFSLTHLSGPGCDTYQDVPFMPVIGDVTSSPAAEPVRYIATFSHANERATAGSYRVALDNGAKVELTATPRTGVGRISYPAGSRATLLVNTAGSIMGTEDAQVTIGRDTISGFAASGHFCGKPNTYRVYFYATFDRPFQRVGTWNDGTVTPGSTVARGGAPDGTGHARDVAAPGPGSGAFVGFDTRESTTVTVRVGLSFVSVDGARANLVTESAAAPFDVVAASAREAWNKRLGRIQVTGGSADQHTIFYTALYHALLQPNVFSDVDGRYPGFDKRIHITDPAHPVFTNFSGWDIYHSEAQLLAMVAPAEASGIAQSMTTFAAQGGSWDRWTVANDYTGVMNGDPYHIIVSDMFALGARDFDANAALRLMVRGATEPSTGYEERPGLTDYLRSGWVPDNASDTLEYTSADFAIAQLAGRLGAAPVHETFLKRAHNWRTLYNPRTGYLQPRHRDGSFALLFDPADPNGYVEGNGAQYTWMVPFDHAGLVSTLGGAPAVNARLDSFFSRLNAGTHQPYAFLGNEPTLQTPWIYDFTGAPYKTQSVVNRVRQQLWRAGPNGLVGNDDLGEMSSWYVWSALGMFPAIPGRAELILNSPQFTSAKIIGPGTRTITINAPTASTARPYVTALKVDGKNWSKPWLPESFVATGGTLDFTLSPDPDPTWGANPTDAPPSFPAPAPALAPAPAPAPAPAILAPAPVPAPAILAPWRFGSPSR